MAKSGKNKDRTPAEGQGGAATTRRPAAWLRVLVSVAVTWHLFVVFISPLSVQPASILVTSIATSPLVRWYSDPLYLNQGYHFFGPDPPRNQIMRYRVADASGELLAEGSFPDREDQWPRLLYHRHMMLSDQAGDGPPDLAREDWLQFSMRAYGRHLLRKYEGDRVTVECVLHNPLSPRESLEGADPNGPDTFASITWVEESAATLDQPLPIPAAPRREPDAPTAEPLPEGGFE